MVSDELTKNLGIHRTRDDGSGENTKFRSNTGIYWFNCVFGMSKRF